MAIYADMHVHTTFSSDGKGSMDEMIQKALSLGLRHICFTEHNDFDYPRHERDPENIFLLNVDSYLYELLTKREKYGDRIKILFGIELGVDPAIVQKNITLSQSHDFDFIIASSHVCHGRDPYYPDFYEGRSEKEAYREYFESELENVQKFSNFDVYGHLDYVVRYGPTQNRNYRYADYGEIIDEILRFLIKNNKGLEVNTGGFRCGIGSTNPCIDIIKRYHELGGRVITIGSDAHEPKYLTDQFSATCEMLQKIGFKYYAVYEKRQPEYFKLDTLL